ncbi:MAG: hypothetical protein ACRCTQ_02040 [Brevinemataceae bacterium]
MFIIILLSLLIIPADTAGQQTEIPIVENNTEILSNTLPEIAELRLEFITQGLSEEKMFRLASFYLKEKLYGKASEFYGLYIEQKKQTRKKFSQEEKIQLASAHYNRAISLFLLNWHDSAKNEFESAYRYNPSLHDSLRMIGTIYFVQKNKPKTLLYWKKYLAAETNLQHPERIMIEDAAAKIADPNFQFEPQILQPSYKTNDSLWPFINPDTIPYPDAIYEKKRVI